MENKQLIQKITEKRLQLTLIERWFKLEPQIQDIFSENPDYSSIGIIEMFLKNYKNLACKFLFVNTCLPIPDKPPAGYRDNLNWQRTILQEIYPHVCSFCSIHQIPIPNAYWKN